MNNKRNDIRNHHNHHSNNDNNNNNNTAKKIYSNILIQLLLFALSLWLLLRVSILFSLLPTTTTTTLAAAATTAPSQQCQHPFEKQDSHCNVEFRLDSPLLDDNNQSHTITYHNIHDDSIHKLVLFYLPQRHAGSPILTRSEGSMSPRSGCGCSGRSGQISV